MNYFDWYIKQLADYNGWVRIPTLALACVSLTGAFYNLLWFMPFIFIGICLAASDNYY
jgi:hypothetical protein